MEELKEEMARTHKLMALAKTALAKKRYKACINYLEDVAEGADELIEDIYDYQVNVERKPKED